MVPFPPNSGTLESNMFGSHTRKKEVDFIESTLAFTLFSTELERLNQIGNELRNPSRVG